MPLVRLRSLLRLPSRQSEREAVLVLRSGDCVGLRGFAGTALLGDGRVLMVLDVKELLSCWSFKRRPFG